MLTPAKMWLWLITWKNQQIASGGLLPRCSAASLKGSLDQAIPSGNSKDFNVRVAELDARVGGSQGTDPALCTSLCLLWAPVKAPKGGGGRGWGEGRASKDSQYCSVEEGNVSLLGISLN